MERKGKRTIGASSNKVQQRRQFSGSEISQTVRGDDTTSPEKRGEVFAPSVSKRVLDHNPGFGAVKPTIEEPQTGKGLNTLSSDSRKQQLPEQGGKMNIHGKRMDEHTNNGDTSTNTVT